MFESTWKNIALSLVIIALGILYLLFWEFFVRYVLGVILVLLGIIGLIVTLKESGSKGTENFPDFAEPEIPPPHSTDQATKPQPEEVASAK